MKSKLSGVIPLACVAFVACATWWTGCSSDGGTATNNSDAGGGTPEAGGTTPDTGAGTPDTGAGTDAAKESGVDSGSNLGPFIDIPYGAASCPAFTPCGGDVKGSWKVSGGCVTEEVLADAKAKCPTLVESNVKFHARGTVVATATMVTRNTEVKYTADLAFPAACKPTQAGFNTCAAVGQGLVLLGGLDTATCTDDVATGGCNCAVADSFADQSSDSYTTMDTTLTTGTGGTARTFDYCVNPGATELAYKETTAKALPALLVLTK